MVFYIKILTSFLAESEVEKIRKEVQVNDQRAKPLTANQSSLLSFTGAILCILLKLFFLDF